MKTASCINTLYNIKHLYKSIASLCKSCELNTKNCDLPVIAYKRQWIDIMSRLGADCLLFA